MILTIDIGGTAIKSAVYDTKGFLITEFDNQLTQVSEIGNEISSQIISLCDKTIKSHAIKGVAIATAGVVNSFSGEIIHANTNIKGYVGVNLKILIKRTFNLPCVVENDVNAMAMGELWMGAAKQMQSALCVTLGTGVGGALIVNGQLWRGDNFLAGEIGYLPISENKTLEQTASTSAMLLDYYQKTGNKIDGKAFFKCFSDGDCEANDALNEMLNALAQGLSIATYLFSPQAIVIGGGIAVQKSIIEPKLKKLLAQKMISQSFMPRVLTCAQLGNKAGMLGALYYFLEQNNHLTSCDRGEVI